jgi:hypothetical protein
MQNESKDEWHLAKQIAAGILMAAVVLGGVYFVIQIEKARRVNAALAGFSRAIKDISQEQAAELQAARDAREAQNRARVAEEQRRRKAKEDEAQRIRLEAARRTQAAADRARAEQATALAKERAWEQFFKPAKNCLNPPDWETQVECGNAHIRAQREFETKWAAGDLL